MQGKADMSRYSQTSMKFGSVTLKISCGAPANIVIETPRYDYKAHHKFYRDFFDDHFSPQLPHLWKIIGHPNFRPHKKWSYDLFEVRNIDGSHNNLIYKDLGKAGTAFTTISGYEYGNGISTPNDIGRPDVRDVSNLLFSQAGDLFNHHGMSNFLWIWGQFLDHDINLTLEGHEKYDIPVTMGDPYFDPYATGTQTIGFTRSGYAEGSGTSTDNPRLQVNTITAYIDASNVYGSTKDVANALRDSNGKLLTSDGNLLPVVYGNRGPEFIAGDVRVNENVVLTSMHTLFVREHNYWVDQLKAKHPHLTGDQLYQYAKAIVEAEIQHITYDEFLPALLGKNAMSAYAGYNASIDPRIATEFATAAFRVGHTMLSSDIFRIQENGIESDYGHLTLQQAFFRPDMIMNQGGIDDILRGVSASYAQDIDAFIIDDVRNFLFGPPGAGGFDLVSLNIQRGRDHGLPDYNDVRLAYGLNRIESFMDLTGGNSDLAEKLKLLYGDIDKLDLWVGGLLEAPHEEAMVGETFYTIIADQFTRLRDGDRFWYENRLDKKLVEIIKNTSLSDIILRNTDIDHLQDDIFSMKYRIGGDDANNTLYGSDGDDLLIGFAGNDILYGGGGNDVLYGAAGADIFVFDSLSTGLYIIRDFKVGEDFIDIRDLISPESDIDALLYLAKNAQGTEFGLKGGATERTALALLENVFKVDLNDILLPQETHIV